MAKTKMKDGIHDGDLEVEPFHRVLSDACGQLLELQYDMHDFASSLEAVGMTKPGKRIRQYQGALSKIGERLQASHRQEVQGVLKSNEALFGGILVSLLDKVVKEKKPNPPYKVHHYDTFDKEAVQVAEKDGYKTIEEAIEWIKEHYGARLADDGADSVDVVNKNGDIVAKFKTR